MLRIKSKKDILLFSNSLLTILGIVAYAGLVIYYFYFLPDKVLKMVIYSALSFILLTIVRKIINKPRPKFNDSIYSKKQGESFPSRHAFSIFLIAFLWIPCNSIAGIFLCIAGFILCYVRISIRAHSLSDVVAGALFALLCAIAMYFLLA